MEEWLSQTPVTNDLFVALPQNLPCQTVPAAACPAVTHPLGPSREGVSIPMDLDSSGPNQETSRHSSPVAALWQNGAVVTAQAVGQDIFFPAKTHGPFWLPFLFRLPDQIFPPSSPPRGMKRLRSSQRRDPSLSAPDIKAACLQASKSPSVTAEPPQGC